MGHQSKQRKRSIIKVFRRKINLGEIYMKQCFDSTTRLCVKGTISGPECQVGPGSGSLRNYKDKMTVDVCVWTPLI